MLVLPGLRGSELPLPNSSYETTLKANRRISNIEPQNVEVWNRFRLRPDRSLSLYLNKPFDTKTHDGRHALFDVRCWTFDLPAMP
jgi:hypothetical protein